MDWVLKSTLPDQNTVLEESMFHSMGQVWHSVCGGSERQLPDLHDVLFPGFSEVEVPDFFMLSATWIAEELVALLQNGCLPPLIQH